MDKHTWIQSTENRNIELYASSNSLDKLISPYLFIGGIHGDEPEGVYLAESFLEWLKSNKINRDLILIPCINIDGYKKNQRTNGNGVDINRNFPSKKWSSTFSQDRYYPGKQAGSEVEIQGLVKLIHQVKPKMIFHFHSWKPCVVVTGPLNLPEVNFLTEASGFEVVDDIGYPTPGSLGDYGWNELQIPIICTEDTEHRTRDLSWLHFGEGLKKIVQY